MSMRITGAAGVLALCAAPAMAQVNVQWVQYANQTSSRLVADPTVGSADTEEKDYAVGDFNRDGWTDLVVVRKQPFTTAGKQRGVLFMNENGVLTDRTAQFAAAALGLPGDQGLLTPANNRDVVVADFNNDGWPDFATAVTISDSDPKPISHPRIYMNLGAPGGNWAGFRFEPLRTPQLYVLNGAGGPDMANPWPGRFCSIAAGDVDNDGDMDLYLGDYDGGTGTAGEPAGKDINDRLWLNDGAGNFTDSYQTRMTAQMLLSAFSAASNIRDMNGDGFNDVVKSTGLQTPQQVSVSYRSVANNTFDRFQVPMQSSPYFVSVGDLNNDNRLDFVETDDNADHYLLNQGNDGLGRVIWGATTGFSFAAGNDDGFGSQSLIADLDQDGWKDVLISDVDVDDPTGYATEGACPGSPTGMRRLHVYHNLANAPNVTLKEEVQQSGTGGWKGVVGPTNNDLVGTHNVAALDIDRDGDKDLVIGRTCSTQVWVNTSNPCRTTVYGQTTNNSTGAPAIISATGVPAASVNDLQLTVTGLPVGAHGIFFASPIKTDPCVPANDGKRCAGRRGDRYLQIGAEVTANGSGVATLNVNLNAAPFTGVGAGALRYAQFRFTDASGGPSGINFSNAVELKMCE
jgi:FG-GAP-like repeat